MAQERLAFTRPAAERIARAVRIVEAGNRDSQGLRFEHPMPSQPGNSVRMAYYTATSTWNRLSFTSATTVNDIRTIQFAFPTNSIATAVAINHFATLGIKSTSASDAVRSIAVVKDAGAWRVIASEC